MVFTNVLVDAANDRLYVLSRARKEIYVWDNASTVGVSDSTPTRTFTAGEAPVDIAVDSANRGYIVDRANAILSFDDVHTLTGSPAPNRTVSGAATQLSSPKAVFLYE